MSIATKLISIRLIVLHKLVMQHTPDDEHNKVATAFMSVATPAIVGEVAVCPSCSCAEVVCAVLAVFALTAGRQPRSPATRPASGCASPPAEAGNCVGAIV